MNTLVGADRAEDEHDRGGAWQVERGARREAVGPRAAVQEARVTVVNELDPRVGGKSPPRDLRRGPGVDDDGVGRGKASPERPVVPANPLVRAHVVDRHHHRRAAADQGPQQRVEPRREQALHVDDPGPRAAHPSAERLHVAEVAGVGGKAALDLEGGRQVRELPLAIGQERDLDPGARERGTQIPGVVRDAAPAAGLDHEGLHRGPIAQDEASERSRRAQAACFSLRLAARC